MATSSAPTDPALEWLMANDPDFARLTPRQYLKQHGILTPEIEVSIDQWEVDAGDSEFIDGAA